MESLIRFDQDLLLFLNSFRSPFWDNFFWIHTSVNIWVPLYITLIFVIIKEQRSKAWITILALILLVVLCDQISYHVFKNGIERLRPSQEPALEGLVNLVNNKKGGLYGFVSGHATNSFGLALFSSLLFRYRWYTVFIMTWAVVNSYSRIYLGLHYPGDILAGILLGFLIAWGIYRLYLYLMVRFKGATLESLKKPALRMRDTDSGSFSIPSLHLLIFAGVLLETTIFLSSRLLLQLM